MSSKQEYIVKPFTIDGKNSKTLDDGFSITLDELGRPSLNVHISSVGLEFINRGYDLQSLMGETRSADIKNFIGSKEISNYSLQVGVRKVLTVRIKNINNASNSYFATCEYIEIDQNCRYDDCVVRKEFDYHSNDIINGLKHSNNEELVVHLMSRYSLALSHYLLSIKTAYFIKNKLNAEFKLRKGSFTAPLRKRECLINQFIILQEMKDRFENYFSEEVFLFEIDKQEDIKNRGKQKIKGKKKY